MAKELSFEDEQDLVRRCQKGDPRAFEELVCRYQQSVLNLVYHHLGYRNDLEDVAQKIFTKIYFSLGKFDSKRPFFPWLYRIALNQCYDELRSLRRQKTHTFTELSVRDVENIEGLASHDDPTAGSAQERTELHALLLKLLDQLPPRQKEAIVLRDLEDVPYDEMATLLNCTEQAARLKVFRARSRLRTLMERAMRRHGYTR